MLHKISIYSDFFQDHAAAFDLPFMNDDWTSSSENLRSPSEVATSAYCCAIGRLGLKRVPNASKQISRFLLYGGISI